VSSPASFATFDTRIGMCGIAWTPRGICGFQLPEASAEITRVRLQRRFAATTDSVVPPDFIRKIIADVQRLLAGEPVDFVDVELEPDGIAEFAQRVYALTRRIPAGSTRTYGELATELGDPTAARAVGRALAQNPYPVIVPCHRVLAAQDRAGGFSAPGGVTTKLRLLELERSRTPFDLT
jgi:methylated-DNA-[protein]-cysteine S-methyltransferase